MRKLRGTGPGVPGPITSNSARKSKISLLLSVGNETLFRMAKRTPPTHPKARRQTEALGERLRAARLRRGMTQEALAERVGVSIPTLGKLEAGDPTTSLATVLRMLTALGLGDDIDRLAADDHLGRALQDNALKRPRARRRTGPTGTAP